MTTVFAGILAALAAFASGFSVGYRDLATTIIPRALDPQPVQVATATVLFGGDMMFDRSVRTAMRWKGDDFVFSCIASFLQEQDLVVANLEGPITAHVSLSATTTPGHPDNMTFTFPLSTADLLYRHNIRMVNLGNNHIENFGTGGVRSTMAMLTSEQVDHFGDPIAHRVATTDIGDIPLAFINYNEFAGNPAQNASTTISQIRAAHATGYIPVVYTHWGIEYATVSPQYLRDLAYRFVDAGAEFVIGSHPHVVADHELYRGKHIYYSLGNFVFDQYFSPEVSHGLLLQIVFTPAGVGDIQEIPIVLNRDRTTCLQSV
jgi:poly-gamma-glutamate synthesis protein (capsule biosynthesis protein)